jgi:ferric-dicitrate binding protein FerR (iron transport regulator)
MKQTEQLRHDDKNLREAVRRDMADAPQLPADFSLRLQQQLQSDITPRRRWYRAASAIAALVVVGGLMWAINSLFTLPKQTVEQTQTHVFPQEGLEGAAMIQFSNTPLDSVLSVVCTHYGRAVCFRDDALQRLRFTIAWDSVQPLGVFLDNVNEFEGLRLTDERDTIFVEPTGKEEEP